MRSLLLASAATVAALLMLPDPAASHGGTYRGPGDTVPPGSQGGGGGSGPPTAGPGVDSPPPRSGPRTPTGQPLPPGPPPTGKTRNPTTGGLTTGPDLSQWEFWWGFNKDPYLQLKTAVHARGRATGSDTYYLGHGQHDPRADALAPSAEDRARARRALLAALERESEDSNDVLTGAMIALAKIGEEVDVGGELTVLPVLTSFLPASNVEVQETAALAMGILATEDCIDPLLALLRDNTEGRHLVQEREVPYRVRAFAAYGLGLAGARLNAVEARERVVHELVRHLESPAFSTRDIKVACMSALGLVPLDPNTPLAEDVDVLDPLVVAGSREGQVAYLLRWLDLGKRREDMRVHDWHVRAHAPTALARLAADLPQVREQVVPVLAALLEERGDAHDLVKMSSALALGELVDADGGGPDGAARQALLEATTNGHRQTRRFALIALAKAAGRPGQGEEPWRGAAELQDILLRQLQHAKSGLRPWVALAIGVHVRALHDRSGPDTADLKRALRHASEKERSPADAGAHLIGIGLTQDPDAVAHLLERLEFFNGRPVARGQAAVGLGLLDDAQAKPALKAVLLASRYKPDLLRSCAVGLGLLGDKTLVPVLTEELARSKALAAQAALATALGTIGDRSAIDPLVELLADEGVSQTARGFAAVALGMVCDRGQLPWSVPYSLAVNYRASTATLTGQGVGLLDIL